MADALRLLSTVSHLKSDADASKNGDADTFNFVAAADDGGRSSHTGGTNFLLGDGSVRFAMGDGSVRFIRDSIAPEPSEPDAGSFMADDGFF